ncbi:hypothetical protein HWV07_08745 [Natronomonas salina]|uniref:DpnII family type II restriction endonuclease n=1 Tax=Natronomonas salina TaxID=1710540 RepID=UPI0015B67AAD|nr:DpnII family type II restriction endonuclease [Natronomonas salina]QLD89112.1 hypothetical protein HWV07_08745 [Natronomonas salina]
MYVRQSEPPTDDFLIEFFRTARPGSIPDDAFLDLETIRSDLEYHGFADQSPFETIDALPTTENEFVNELARNIAEHSAPKELVKTCFLLVGHSTKKDVYVSTNRSIPIAEDAAVASGNLDQARTIAETLCDIGLHKVLQSGADARSIALGVRIGFQTDARKGRSGTLYEDAVEEALQPIVDSLTADGYDIWLDTQYTTGYKPENKDQEKQVDFAIFHKETLLVAFESNCYTTGGSKVSSTEREYDDLSSKMRENETAFVWITDGYGWEWKESSTLREAYEDVHDLYNLAMVEESLEDDLRTYFGDKFQENNQNTLDGY